MFDRATRDVVLTLGLGVMLVRGPAASTGWLAQSQHATGVQEKSRTRRVSDQPAASPTPPVTKEEESDEVVRVETNLTNIFFTAAYSNKRFVSNLRKEDIRVLEDGQPQEVFTFQQSTDLPLSIAILIDTSQSEERTLPDEKSAARGFLEAVMHPGRDEAAVVSFTGDVTL